MLSFSNNTDKITLIFFQPFFIDHSSRTTTFIDPRLPTELPSNLHTGVMATGVRPAPDSEEEGRNRVSGETRGIDVLRLCAHLGDQPHQTADFQLVMFLCDFCSCLSNSSIDFNASCRVLNYIDHSQIQSIVCKNSNGKR